MKAIKLLLIDLKNINPRDKVKEKKLLLSYIKRSNIYKGKKRELYKLITKI